MMETSKALLDYVNMNITRLTTQQLNADYNVNYNNELYRQTDNFLEILENISMGLHQIKTQFNQVSK